MISQKIIDFVKSLLSKEGSISSKRFWGSIITLSAIILTYLQILCGDPTNDIQTNKLYLTTSLYFFGSTCLGLGLIDKSKNNV